MISAVNIFLNQFGISGLPETWITADELYGAILVFLGGLLLFKSPATSVIYAVLPWSSRNRKDDQWMFWHWSGDSMSDRSLFLTVSTESAFLELTDLSCNQLTIHKPENTQTRSDWGLYRGRSHLSCRCSVRATHDDTAAHRSGAIWCRCAALFSLLWILLCTFSHVL